MCIISLQMSVSHPTTIDYESTLLVLDFLCHTLFSSSSAQREPESKFSFPSLCPTFFCSLKACHQLSLCPSADSLLTQVCIKPFSEDFLCPLLKEKRFFHPVSNRIIQHFLCTVVRRRKTVYFPGWTFLCASAAEFLRVP